MGLTNQDDLYLDQPGQMQKFLHGLAMQEHGKAGAYFQRRVVDWALTGIRPGLSASPGNAEPAGTVSSAVDRAAGLMNAAGEQAGQALGSQMTPGEWCADFVNGVLKSSGKGVNSSMASAFGG